MATVGVSGGDRLSAALAGIAEKLQSAKTVQVGFMKEATYPDGTGVAMVAAIQNYGAPAAGIPARPFFSDMVKEQSPSWGGKMASVLKATDYDAKRTLGLMGEEIGGELIDSIINTTDPALSPVTLLLRERFGNNPGDIKFSDVQQARRDIAAGVVPNVTGTQAKPLVWTGNMENSVQYDVDGDVSDVQK